MTAVPLTDVEIVWYALGLSLVAYMISAGADFGGGVWDLFAVGPRRKAQRKALAEAIAPIWEANHIWLIVMVVLLFTVFPRAFATISIALHIPISLALIGIVLRGSAFAFRSYGFDTPTWQTAWSRTFAISSLLTPCFLGMSLAALATGDIRWADGHVTSGFLAGWTTLYALLAGLFTTALCALLAAVYMTDLTEGELRADFKRRALLAGGVAAVFGALALWVARRDAPDFFAALTAPGAPLALVIGAILAGPAAIAALLIGRYRLARVATALQVALVVLGCGVGMDHHLVRPDLRIEGAGAVPEVISPLLPALGVAGLVVVPALWYLYRVFRRV